MESLNKNNDKEDENDGKFIFTRKRELAGMVNLGNSGCFYTTHFIAGSAMGMLVLLTWWMQQSKRFDFGRAFKICFYVLLLSVLPAFLFVVVPSDDLNRFDLIFQSVTFLALSLLLCLICSWIARRPKQYY